MRTVLLVIAWGVMTIEIIFDIWGIVDESFMTIYIMLCVFWVYIAWSKKRTKKNNILYGGKQRWTKKEK